MLLLLHITIALVSVAYTTYLLFAPSRTKLRLSYLLVVTTLLSGFYLVATTGTHILQACTTGLLYTGLVSFGIVRARRMLAEERSRNNR